MTRDSALRREPSVDQRSAGEAKKDIFESAAALHDGLRRESASVDIRHGGVAVVGVQQNPIRKHLGAFRQAVDSSDRVFLLSDGEAELNNIAG